MTLRQPNYDRMLQLGLSGMAEALEEQYHLALPYAHIFSRLLDLVLKLAVRHADSIS